SSNWEYLAVYVAQINPTVVSMKWSPNANGNDVGNGGLALRLDGPTTNANGYLAYITSDATLRLWTIANGALGHAVQTASSAAPAPQPGDKFQVAMSSDGYGHHFDFYLNAQFAGRLTDVVKEFGNAGRLYAGVFLRGNANNDVDDFSLEKTQITTPAAFAVTTPNGGERWLAGSTNIMTWTPRGDIQQVNLEISYNNGATWVVIANGIQNTGAYGWLVPNITSPACRVRISDALDGNPTDVSDAAFAIITSSGAGHALHFDGLDDVARISDNALLSGGPGKSITVEAWLRLSNVQGNNPIIQKFADASQKDWGLAVEDGTLEVSIENDGDNWEYEAGTVTPGAWTHVAFTFDNPANVVHLYVNGIQAGAGAAQPKDMPDTAAPILFGGHAYLNRHITGRMDEVRIWNYARSAAALRDDMNRPLQGNEPGLIGYWRFDEGAGQFAADLSGNNNAIQLGATNAGEASDPAWVLSDAPLSPPNTSSFSFTPLHDAYVRLSSPGQSYPTATNLIQRATSSETVYTYLKFNITGLGWPILNAKLRLYVTDSSDDGGAVYFVSNYYKTTNTEWTEGGLNWNNAPVISGPGLSAAGAVNAGNWIEFDVTSAISSNGVYSFALKNNSSNAVNYSSKEGNHAPELVVITGNHDPPEPVIASFTPSSGYVGIEVTITGTNLGEATEVAFNETTATNFVIASSSEIRATVPMGATTGKIRVTTAAGEAVSDLNFTVTPLPIKVTFTPLEDAEVKSSTPTTNYGHYGIFRLRDGSVKYHSYLKFAVSGLDGEVLRARLRLYVTEGGDDVGAVYSVSNHYHGSNTAWNEGGMTWNNAPAIGGSPLHTIGAAVNVGTWVEFDVTAAIGGDGIYSFGLRNQSTSIVKFSSKEGSNPPELVIEISGTPSLTTTLVNPSEDAEVKSSTPTTNYGGYGIFRLRGGSVQYKSFLKFHVAGLSGAVQQAKLRLYVTEGSDDGGTLYTVSNNYQGSSTPWEEEAIN
ncbi:MAG: DNRLRE domain-containing protein, partial [candidate division KSB1 bacterium]|nr:DNRLRE domain-containing protein [candidate division KSB1 bacterium]